MLAACGGKNDDSGGRGTLSAVTVKTQSAITEPHMAAEEVVGTVRSKLRAAVEAKVSGRVLEYTAVPGQMVKAGDLLATLDAREVQARLDQAKAVLDQARRDFARQEKLIATNATTRQEFDAAQARVKVGEAAVTEAETMMSYARVTAPFDGVITRKLADVGDLAMPGKPLLEIEAPTDLRFEADLPEALLGNVKLGDKMKVMIASVGEPLEAVVSEIAPVADAVSRTFQVKLDLPRRRWPAHRAVRARLGAGGGGDAAACAAIRGDQARPDGDWCSLSVTARPRCGWSRPARRSMETWRCFPALRKANLSSPSDPARLADGQPVTLQP